MCIVDFSGARSARRSSWRSREVTGFEAKFLGEERMDSWIGKLLVPEGSEVHHTDRFQLPYVTRVDYRMARNASMS